MRHKKVPVANLSATLNRVLLMITAILIGILVSYSTANAGVKKSDKFPTTQIPKKKNQSYSCEELEKKRRNPTKIAVKTKKQRRPRWR